jgi:hypothetical protein
MAEPKIRYTGEGPEQGHHQGIPARALTAEEYEALPTELRKVVRESAVYDYAGYKAKVDAQKEDARRDEERAARKDEGAREGRSDAPKGESEPKGDGGRPAATEKPSTKKEG